MAQEFSQQFYKSDAWTNLRQQILLERGAVCSMCGNHIVNSKFMQLHHIQELTPQNISNANISLNPDNLQIVCQSCHNTIHGRYCKGADRKIKIKGVYIVYGSPMAGKATYIQSNTKDGDLIVDMDRLYMAMAGKQIYNKPDKIKYNVLSVRNLLIDNIKTRYGNFNNAWIVGGYANKHDREKLVVDLGAELIYIKADKADCYCRLDWCNDYRQQHKEEWKQYIDKWFDEYRA